jgi:hypothetical protein
MYSGASTTALPVVGFPIRRSRGQRLVSTSPELIAAAHVLLRLLAPRHPPCALILLIVKNSLTQLWSFQGAHEAVFIENSARPTREHRLQEQPVSQNSTANVSAPFLAADVEVDVDLGEPRITDDRQKQCRPSTSWAASGVQELRDP